MSSQAPEHYAIIFQGWQFPGEVVAQRRFRKRLFVDELGWQLSHRSGEEADEFDTESAVYCSLYLRGEVVGCWRAIRSSNEYLGQKLFPQLATLRPYPVHPDIWEISRLGVIRHGLRPQSAAILYALMFQFAVTRGAVSLCGVVSPIHNRNFNIARIKTRRYGPPQVVGVDARGRPMSVFFGEIRLADQEPGPLKNILEPAGNLKVQDDALLLRRTPISA
jgi:N-acyl-L-homoserine lactone synthetase